MLKRLFSALGTRRFEVPLYSSDVQRLVKFTSFASPSGSMINTGMYVENDFHPSVGALAAEAAFTDGDIETPIFTASGSKWSIGIDQGQAYDSTMISLHDDGSAGHSIFWSGSAAHWGGSADSLDVHQSADNYSWTFVKNCRPIYRAPYSGSTYVIHIACNTTQRYVKLHASSGSLRSARGDYIQPTEIQTWQSLGQYETSGSIENEIIVGPSIKKKTVIIAYTQPKPTQNFA